MCPQTCRIVGGRFLSQQTANYIKLLLMEEILHQLIGSLSHYLQGFIHPRWCRISSIHSMSWFLILRLTSHCQVFRKMTCKISHIKEKKRHLALVVTDLTLLGQTWEVMRNPTTVLCIDPLDRKFFMWGFMIPSCKKNDTLKDFGSPWLHTASQNVQSKFSSCATKRNANVQTYQSRNLFFANSSSQINHLLQSPAKVEKFSPGL